MKSFSNLLLEKEELEQQKQKKVKKTKPTVDVKTTNRPAEVQGRMDATDPKQGGYSRVDDSLDSKSSRKTRLGDTTKGSEVKVTKPKGTLAGDEARDLGKLNKRTGKLNWEKNAELQAKRKQRIDIKTGKATQKGVENFALNRGGYSRRNIPKSELGQIRTDARRIASNPSSRAYKEIEASINASDYAGRRAKGDPNAAKLSDVKKALDSKKGKFGVGSANPTRIGKSGGKLPVPTTIGVKQSEVSKKAKAFRQTIEKIKQKKASEIKDPWKTSKVSKGTTFDNIGTKKYDVPGTGPKNPNPDYLAKMQRGASGMDSNVGGGAGGTTGNTTFKDFTKKSGVAKTGKSLEVRNTPKNKFSRITNKGNIINIDPKTGAKTFGGTAKDTSSAIVPYKKGGDLAGKIPSDLARSGTKGSDLVTHSAKLGKLSQTKRAGDLKKFADFRKTANPLLGKNLSKNLTKITGKKALKVLGKPLAGVVDTAFGYDQYRRKGHSKAGSLVRGAIKGGASALGFAGGALAGGLAGGGIGSLVTGAAGGYAGSELAGNLADKIIGSVDKKLKLKTPKKYQRKITGGGTSGGSIPGPGKGSSGKYNFTPLSLGTSTKDYNKGQSAPWKTKKESVEYVQERFRSQAIQTYLKNKAGQQDLTNKANKFKQENPGTDFSKGARMSNPNLTPSSSFNNNSTQQPVPTQTTQARPLGPTQRAAANIDKIASSGPGSGSVKVDGRALMNKLRSDSSNQTQSSTPQAQQAQRPAPQAQRPAQQAQQVQRPAQQAQQAQRPVAQAQPQRTVGGQGNRQRPVKTGGIQLGNAVRKPIGSAINAVRSALSNKGPIRGRSGANAAMKAKGLAGATGGSGGTAPLAKPVTQAPVAKPAPQLTGAQRAQQMAKQRIAQGRNTVTGALKSAAKPKPRVTTWRDLE